VRVLYINNDGGGFADYVETADGTTVGQFFRERLPGREPEDYLIRRNRDVTTADQVLHDGDRISMTPVRIQGARTAA
jgi:hypothetical protein